MKPYLNNHVRLHDISSVEPNMKGLNPLGTLISERGTLVPLMLLPSYEYIGVIGFKAGITRGGHYHRLKTEIMFVIEGELVLEVASKDMRQNKTQIKLFKGSLVEIDPNIWHIYTPKTDAITIDMSPIPYRDGDTLIS